MAAGPAEKQLAEKGAEEMQMSDVVDVQSLEARQEETKRAAVPSPTALVASGLEKSYGRRRVVDGVSLHVERGEVVGLLGANGAGKTTTFYMIIGLERPDKGQVLLGGRDITKLPMYLRARLGIGYLPQEPSVFRKMTVAENILAVLETMRLRRRERFKRLEELIEEFGLGHVRNTRGDALSGGERRRTEIARALATDPQFILLDEPFAGIDPKAVDDIQRMILYLRARGIGILITDHNVRETLGVTDRAYIMAEGRIFRSGAPLELTEDPEVRRLYLGEKFRL
ncbi:LPS export ABC transporter ATP-binding protein [Pyrinomonas methylaliphatogenes]|uniref:ABC-type (Unclassified) transport system, ATPase component n=1 Tax=Pyrinomonas methylaliphatogenes TaxID=454194 RepID=A0A0B6X1E6_9BACT|nr:LPS export ABC transporter ATP-binding protein [Pyrinomonas methylaliphatogenes]CDM66190.1 ABC-type (unclassified) transport system, ATPase component [Pyrinomonas methylaliphatogenes]